MLFNPKNGTDTTFALFCSNHYSLKLTFSYEEKEVESPWGSR